MIWIIIILVIWLTGLSVWFLLLHNHYKKLIDIGGKKDLVGILEKILDRLEEDRISFQKVNKEIEKLISEGELHTQKIGLIRFNPFPDTGGEQSFVLAVLDKNNNGVVISSLHARTTTRWYAKSIINGKGDKIELSKEEEKAIKEADRQN